jgi:hypothetical protein
MSGICRLSGVVEAYFAMASMRSPPFHEGPTVHRCMGWPQLHGVAGRVSRQKEKLHKEVTR